MSKAIPRRSTGGCLTCKRRKKKCDERRPRCTRCELGDFDCLGYGLDDASHDGDLLDTAHDELIRWPMRGPTIQPYSSSLESLDTLIPLPAYECEIDPVPFVRVLQEMRDCLSNIPNTITLEPIVLENATSLIVSQYTKYSQEIFFKPPSESIENGMLWRIADSEITRWSMYLGARVLKDVSSGHNAWRYMEWIFRFSQQILETPPSTQQGPDLIRRLGGLHDLVNLTVLIAGTAIGYSLFMRCVPVFLQLAALDPSLWYDSIISIPEAIANPRYEIMQFIICDTMTALSLGTPPLLHYDTNIVWTDEAPGHYQLMYGFPVGVLLILAKVNAWRTLRLVGQVAQGQSDWHVLEEHLNNWSPTVDHTDGPNYGIARLAIQEAWRQAAMIYLYMGMNEVNSADPRVEAAAQQIVQLVGMFNANSTLELHLLLPCLIAGVTARREKHRAILRRKLVSEPLQKASTFILRSSDFVAVLDHLWHGAGSEGRPVTWDDYVQSRCTILPIV